MPNWLVPLICLFALVGFIGFAFRQGTKVSPDRNNTNFGPSHNDGQVDGCMVASTVILETRTLPDYGLRSGQTRHYDRPRSLPIFPNKRTFSEFVGMSQTCQERKHSQPLRKAAGRSAETICVTIGEILRAVTPTECANYLRNSGYAQS